MAGTLYIVGTPIGNLEDVTMRALRILREVDLVAAEDTRRTARLLQHYSITTPTTSLHEHNERGKGPHLIQRLRTGTSIALVSDAGMPLVSDPGAWLVAEARAAGIPIQVVPGPSSITAALASAGVSGPFSFLGFPPAAGKGRKNWMARFGRLTQEGAVVFFEAPHRLQKTFTELATILGNQPIIVAKELTKVHESVVERPITAWLGAKAAEKTEKGEFVVVVPSRAGVDDSRQAVPVVEALLVELGQLTLEQGLKPRAAAKVLSAKYAIAADELYALHSSRRR